MTMDLDLKHVAFPLTVNLSITDPATRIPFNLTMEVCGLTVINTDKSLIELAPMKDGRMRLTISKHLVTGVI